MAAGFWTELGERRRWDAAAHPFSQRWMEGDLDRRELALYASEYDQVLVAVGRAAKRAARLGDLAELGAFAAAKDEQLAAWRRFARELGWGGWCAWTYGEEPLPATAACARTWEGEEECGLTELLVSCAAVEQVQARAGIVKHPWVLRAELDPLLEGAELEPLLNRVEAVQRGYWLFLDAVEALAVS